MIRQKNLLNLILLMFLLKQNNLQAVIHMAAFLKVITMNIILASKSPRRIEIMREHGIEPEIIPADITESPPLYGGKCDTPMFLALKKAMKVEESADKGKFIIAADTVVYDGRIIGKPKDRDDAEKILMSLSGRSHYVVTGCAVIKAHTSVRKVFAVTTRVTFTDYSISDIADYLAGDEPYDKAGAYAIQGYFGRFVKNYEGSLMNVIGFPWDEIEQALKDTGYEDI